MMNDQPEERRRDPSSHTSDSSTPFASRAFGLLTMLGALTVAAITAAACANENADELRGGSGNGSADDPAAGTEVVPAANALLELDAFGPSALRRQSSSELRGSLLDIFGVDPGSTADLIPADGVAAETVNPFDNNSELQDVATAVVTHYNTFAAEYAKLVVAKPARLLELGGCTLRARPTMRASTRSCVPPGVSPSVVRSPTTR